MSVDEKGLTIELLQDTLHGAGAAAAGHGDVELVVVLGHFGEWWVGCEVWWRVVLLLRERRDSWCECFGKVVAW